MTKIKDMNIEKLLGIILHCDKHLSLDKLKAEQEILTRFKILEKALELMAKTLQQFTLTNRTSIAATIGYFKHKADESIDKLEIK